MLFLYLIGRGIAILTKGAFMKAHFLQEVNDIYFISEQIKQINPSYKLFYNTLHNRYEVHDLSNPFHSLCVTTKDYPSSNLIKTLITTKKENMSALLKQIEEDNQKLDTLKQNNLLDISNQKFKEILNYSQTITHSLSQENISKIVNS